MKERKLNINVIKRVAIVLIIMIAVVFILVKAGDFAKDKNDDTISLVINNRNVTDGLKYDIKIEDDIIYLSMNDIKNYFDKHIYIEEEINEVVTTYDDKIASIGFDANKMTVNGAIKKTNASAIKDGEIIYLPISEMLDVYNIELENIIAHAPYIVNLCNDEKFDFSVDFLKQEVSRCHALGITKLVLHPGASVGLVRTYAINNIIKGLNLILDNNYNVTICLETMSGKGTEVGKSFEELKIIIDGIKNKKIAVINLLGRAELNILTENPFQYANKIIGKMNICSFIFFRYYFHFILLSQQINCFTILKSNIFLSSKNKEKILTSDTIKRVP